ncbi:MAG TPA: FecR domain-containing protein [Planctomycetota bacterium]|nr:FecR domain-containing protein [Planctomycetota bacterium]
MTCAEFEPRLGAHLDGQLAGDERAAVDAHLASCDACRQALEGIRAQHQVLEEAFASDRRANEALAGRVVDAFRGRPRRRLWFISGAAAAAALLLGLLLLRERELSQLRGRLARSEESCRALEEQLRCAAIGAKTQVARLSVATGAVESRARADGEWEAVGPGGGLPEGAWVRTAPRSKCSFDCSDGTELRLNGATEICLEKPRAVRLARGEMFTRVAHDPARFTVTTDQATIEALGTQLNIVHRPSESTVLTVIEGSARMGAQTIASGYLCKVVGGKVQAPVPAHQLALLTKWVNEIVALKGKDSPELQIRVNELLAQIGRTKMEHLVEAEIRALGDHAALPLTRYIQSPESRKDGNRRRDAARILADIASSPSVPDFVALVGDEDPQVRLEIARGLQRLTGQTLGLGEKDWTAQDFARGADAWKKWLQANESTWSVPSNPKK